MDTAVFPQTQGGPFMHAIAAKAVTFYEAMQPSFAEYQRVTLDNAQVLASELKRLGLRLVSGGTDNHLILIDLIPTGVTGKKAEESLDKVGIVVNRDGIPFDPRPGLITSGIRLGTPAITTRGFGKEEMKFIASAIVKILSHIDDRAVEMQVREEVRQLCSRFLVPSID
jgi:glycine hydroxymethyltransferase